MDSIFFNGSINDTLAPVFNQTFRVACSYFRWQWSRELLSALYAVIFVTAMFGNCLIIHIIRVRPNMRIPFNYLIVNMAVADLLDALVTPAIQIWFMYGWIYPPGVIGHLLCRLHLFLAVISISASVLTLTLIAADRYLAIVHSTQNPLTMRKVKRFLIGIWVLSGVVFSYDIYRVQLYNINGQYQCLLHWGFDVETNAELDKVDMMVKFVLLYIIPLVVMAILYTVILTFLWQRKTPGEHSMTNKRNMDNRKMRVLKMLLTIVILFAVCWLPVHINHILIAYHKATYMCTLSFEGLMVFYMIAHANISINPALYFIFNKNFRDGARHVLCGTRKFSTVEHLVKL
ncbi:tachykinin-like peptides receptor 86C isoform X2 [Nematostella vectensis]|uniref:tachykinin-like peptides receptor 86C isoform X2 n=1 Tax=Nematostella vectensis TaxID=45351 RepID=UPI0020777924|nr:tachykinin-like peptides receptor 86C isoform X2 [Nematostella vectensis]